MSNWQKEDKGRKMNLIFKSVMKLIAKNEVNLKMNIWIGWSLLQKWNLRENECIAK